MVSKTTKRARLLEDSDVERWHMNVACGSPIAAEVHLRRLSLFCEQNGVAPKELVELGRRDRKQLEDMVEDHITMMDSKRKSPGYIAGIIKGVKSWLAHNEIELKRKIRISNRNATPTIEDERVPEKEELKALLMYGDERARAKSPFLASFASDNHCYLQYHTVYVHTYVFFKKQRSASI